MVMYQGCMAGKLVCVPSPDIDYVSTQNVTVSIEQCAQQLAQESIRHIDTVGQSFKLKFTYLNLTSPVQLIIESVDQDEQFHKDNPVKILTLVLDDLFTIPHLLHNGKLYKTTQLIDTGNTLYQFGRLIYEFNLPLVVQTNIVPK
jgi:hypothetical protein